MPRKKRLKTEDLICFHSRWNEKFCVPEDQLQTKYPAEGNTKEVETAVEELNQRHAIFWAGEEYRIMTDISYTEYGGELLLLTDLHYLRGLYANRTCFDGERERSIVDVWLEHPKRRFFENNLVAFDLEVPAYFEI